MNYLGYIFLLGLCILILWIKLGAEKRKRLESENKRLRAEIEILKGKGAQSCTLSEVGQGLLKDNEILKNKIIQLNGSNELLKNKISELNSEQQESRRELESLLRGRIGESQIEHILYRYVDTEKYILKNVYIPKRQGTTEIDLIIITSKGIIVVESKNYNGSVYGDEKYKNWLYYLNNNKYEFYNPIRQNMSHINALKSYTNLPEEYFYSMIVFSNDNFKVGYNSIRTAITSYSKLPYTFAQIQKESKVNLSKNQMNDIFDMLHIETLKDSQEKYEHIERVKFKSRKLGDNYALF